MVLFHKLLCSLEKGRATYSSILARGAWRATVHGVTKNKTWLSDWAHTPLHSSAPLDMGPPTNATPTFLQVYLHQKRDTGTWGALRLDRGSGGRWRLPVGRTGSLRQSCIMPIMWSDLSLGTNEPLSLSSTTTQTAGEHNLCSPAACKSGASVPEEGKRNHLHRLTQDPDLHTDHPPVALNKEGQHRITSAIDFHHLQTVPVEEIVNADLAIGTSTDDPEEEKGHVENLPGREQSDGQYPPSGEPLGCVCSRGLWCVVGSGWGLMTVLEAMFAIILWFWM